MEVLSQIWHTPYPKTFQINIPAKNQTKPTLKQHVHPQKCLKKLSFKTSISYITFKLSSRPNNYSYIQRTLFIRQGFALHRTYGAIFADRVAPLSNVHHRNTADTMYSYEYIRHKQKQVRCFNNRYGTEDFIGFTYSLSHCTRSRICDEHTRIIPPHSLIPSFSIYMFFPIFFTIEYGNKKERKKNVRICFRKHQLLVYCWDSTYVPRVNYKYEWCTCRAEGKLYQMRVDTTAWKKMEMACEENETLIFHTWF